MRFLFFMLLVLIATPVMAHQCGEFNSQWQTCETNADCIVAENMCGFPSSINKNSAIEVESYNKCMGPMISCAMPPKGFATGLAECKANKCVYIEKKRAK